MLDIQGRFQVSFFANFAPLTPKPETVSKLTKVFESWELLPTTYTELGPQGPQPRIRLASIDNEWVIDFDCLRISIDKNATTPKGSNLGPLDKFAEDAVDMLRRALRFFERPGSRLALVTTGLMGAMTGEALNQAYCHICRPIPFFEKTLPSEWITRTTTRVPLVVRGEDELTNVIVKVSRIQALLKHDPSQGKVDRLEIAFDINTFQENTDTRFDVDCAIEFFRRGIESRELILQQLKERLNG